MKSKPVIGGSLVQGESDGQREEVSKAGGVTRL